MTLDAGLPLSTDSVRDMRSIAVYDTYLRAQEAVDYLSDREFPVQRVSIVGRDLRLVENVSGRLTNGRAALLGAGGGAWFGLLLGLLFGLFTPGLAWIAVVLGAVALSAGWGALFGYFGHRATRGRRDFTSVKGLEAAAYDVQAEAAVADEAASLLARYTFVG